MATPLAQLDHRPFVTDGGLETDLLFHHGVTLPDFAAFPLVGDTRGRSLLSDYYDGYAEIARRHDAALLLESPTWRASPDWAGRLGYSPDELDRLNQGAVAVMRGIGARHDDLPAVLVSGQVGPRGDGYQPGAAADSEESTAYHQVQIASLAEAGVDLVTVMTMTGTAEPIGIVRAARACGVPVLVSFTVETDGRLPDGTTLEDAVAEVDREAPPDWFGVNCAHPTHLARALADGGAWRERVVGVRANASALSHAELDEAEELDEGDPEQFAVDHLALGALLPRLSILGGCCGTDARHVAALWAAPPQVLREATDQAMPSRMSDSETVQE